MNARLRTQVWVHYYELMLQISGSLTIIFKKSMNCIIVSIALNDCLMGQLTRLIPCFPGI